jgi:hypothetical protein
MDRQASFACSFEVTFFDLEMIEKVFFAFTWLLKKLNGGILFIRFDIWFTGYKPEFNFLVGSNLGGPKNFFS